MRKTHSLFLLSLVCLGLAGCSSTCPISLAQGKYLISDTNGLYLKARRRSQRHPRRGEDFLGRTRERRSRARH